MECVVDRGVTRYSRSVAVVKLKILPVPGKVASTFSIFRDPAPGAPPNSTRRNMPSTETRHLCVLIVKWDTLVPGFV